MDGDPAVESELDTLSLIFPLPYRVGFIVVLAIWGWGINLQVLNAHHVDVPRLIRYPQRQSVTHPPHHLTTYRLASALSTVLGISLLFFWLFTRGDAAAVREYDWFPLSFLVLLAATLAAAPLPMHGGLPSTGRKRLFSMLRRVSLGGLAEAHDGKFGDVLLADVLTSYAKVFGDLYVALCMFFRVGGSATARPDRNCGGTVVVPLMLAIPSAIRLRQCLIEYIRVRRAPYKESAGWGGQHLANALKYSTAFPVIILSALQRSSPPGAPGSELGSELESAQPGVSRAWLAAVLVNSLYSFYWDVAKDWDLTLFSSEERSARNQPWGLRRQMVFRPAAVYHLVVALDLMLRCTWALKLNARLGGLGGAEGSVFLVEVLEVVRRWAWVFLRVETEWVRSLETGPIGLGVEDVLLGDYQGKDDISDDG